MLKVVRKREIHQSDRDNERKLWLSKAPEERIAAVEFYRRQFHGDYPERLVENKRSTGRTQDLADLESLGGKG